MSRNIVTTDKLVKFKTMLEYGTGKETLRNVYRKFGLNTRPQSILMKNSQINAVKNRLMKNHFVGMPLQNSINEFKAFKLKNGIP